MCLDQLSLSLTASVRLCLRLCSQELAIARHELRALRELRVEMDPQVAADGATAPVDPRAEVARLEQVPHTHHTHHPSPSPLRMPVPPSKCLMCQAPGGTADELARVRSEVSLLQQHRPFCLCLCLCSRLCLCL